MRSNLALADVASWHGDSVIRAPSTLGKVEKGFLASRPPEISCDWFQGTMPLSIRDSVLERLAVTFGAPALRADIPPEMRCYRECLEFPNGSRLYQSNRYKDTCCIVLSGATNPSHHFPLIQQLVQAGVKATRFDLAFDDRRGQVSIDDICNHLHSGTVISRWKNAAANETLNLPSGSCRGRKVQFGSKASDAYLVTYDKGLETETAEEGEWVRWELRLSDEQANQFVTEFLADNPDAADGDLRKHVAKASNQSALLCHDAADYAVLDTDIAPELVDRFKRLALAALKSRLSFRDRSTALNTSRAAVLPWWESFLEYFDPANTGKVDVSDLDYDEAQHVKRQARNRELSARTHAEELLTEIYEEHIRPHQPKLAHRPDLIPEYGDAGLQDDGQPEDILSLVGLASVSATNVIPFLSKRDCRRPPIAKIMQSGMGAKVIPFPLRAPRNSVLHIAAKPTDSGRSNSS